MFRIGEFSRIAQVSSRLLRYYDEIGLLSPAHTDTQTGYRFYTARQLPRLNRILALKELGLKLDQIQRFLDQAVSVEEIRGMLRMKQVEMEQQIQAEIARLRYIEARIKQIELDGNFADYDVVLKSMPAMYFFCTPLVLPTLAQGAETLRRVSNAIPPQVTARTTGHFAVLLESEQFEWENIEMQVGWLTDKPVAGTANLPDGASFALLELGPVETMLTVTRIGNPYEGHGSYTALGNWADANGYAFVGPVREVFIELPIFGAKEPVTEIQWPVRKVAATPPLLG